MPSEHVLNAAARILAEVLVTDPADRMDALAFAIKGAVESGSLDEYRRAASDAG